MGPELAEPDGTERCFQRQVTPMQEFHIRLLDDAGRQIQVIPALAETQTIALVRAAHIATETGAADYQVEACHRHSPVRARL